MSERPYDPISIGRVLDEQTARFGMGGAKQVGTLFSSWSRIVGSQVAAHVEPSSLRNGVLKLTADSPTWATEIGYLRETIKAQANSALGAEVVAKIEVRTGPLKGPRGAERGQPGTSGKVTEMKSERAGDSDPMTAFERARKAWLKRRGRTP